MDSEVKGRKFYYLNREYESGMVSKQLKDMRQYDVIAGLDFGHGESVIYKIYKGQTGEWELDHVTMTNTYDSTVPTLMTYQNGKPVIGRAAQYADPLIQCFKEAPQNWGAPGAVGGKTFGNMMEDYIAALWSGAMQFDEGLSEAAAKDGSLLIAVGCPASPAWTDPDSMEEYAALVRRATGCRNVAVMPESNAAIMNAICSSKKGRSLDLSRGVAIYDAGSSTIDFTYVLMGKVMITRSLRVGGSDLDRAIREYILRANNKAGAAESKIESLKLRFYKEEFYNSGGKSQNSYNLKVGAEKVAYTMDDKLMKGAIWGTPLEYPAERRFDGVGAITWGKAVSGFIDETLKLADEKGCGAVVLTGGTSRVTEFGELVDKAYSKLNPKPEIRQEADPSASVAKGLCQAKLRECEAASALEGIVKCVDEKAGEQGKVLQKMLAACIFGGSMAIAAKGVGPLVEDGKPHRFSEITAAAKTALDANEQLLVSLFENWLRENSKEYVAPCREEITKQLNELSGKLYGGQLTGSLSLPEIESDLLECVLQTLDFDSIIADSMFTIVDFMGFIIVLTLVMTIIGFFLAIPIAEYIDKLRKRDRMLSAKQCAKILEGMKNPSLSDAKDHAIDSINKNLQEDFGIERAFSEMADNLLDVSLGMILLEVFEEYGAEEPLAASAEEQPAL